MKIPYQDEIKFVRYHLGKVQDAGTGSWYEAYCGGRLLPIEQYEYDRAMWAKFKCQKCGKWINIELHNWRG